MLQSRLRTGERDRVITIQSYTETNHTTTNQPRKTWADLITLKAKREMPRARSTSERFEANQQVATEVYDYSIRPGSASITHKMRIYDRAEARYFYITAINRPDRIGTLVLTAQYRDNG